MIDKNVVTRIVNEWLEGKDYFLVDVMVSPDDKIVVEIDHAEGVWIDDCVELSRYIESKLNREEEDYELEVGSAGVGQPFKVLQQYRGGNRRHLLFLPNDRNFSLLRKGHNVFDCRKFIRKRNRIHTIGM